MTVALAFMNVSKRFVLQHERPESLQERFVHLLRRRDQAEEFWALRDVSFSVADGETFGIIGRNGAGKSTLLKLATGILQPTSGRVERHRRTYAMLELGAGFHPELSGRDNIYLNGSIHGLSRARMRALFDRIVAFAELERFIDTPVKHYSSGMFMRLGFATAIHMEPELLIIDEILAVGDAAFRRKCTEALLDLKRQGVTILFVSHNEEAVYQFCDRALLLTTGEVAALGTIDDVVAAYASAAARQVERADPAGTRLQVLGLAVLDHHGRETLTLTPGEPWAIEVAVALPDGGGPLRGEVALTTETGSPVVTASLARSLAADGGRVRQFTVGFQPLPLSAGRLRLMARLTLPDATGALALVEHEHPRSIAIGARAHGPLLDLGYQWDNDERAPVMASDSRSVGPGATADQVERASSTAIARPRAATVDQRAAATARAGLVVAASPLEEAHPGWGGPSRNGLAVHHSVANTAPGGDPAAPATRYLAEGYTGGTFAEYLLLANPTADPLAVAIDCQTADAVHGREMVVSLAPWRCQTVAIAPLVGGEHEVALRLASPRPVVAERLVTFRRYPAVAGIAYNRPRAATLDTISGAHLGPAALAAARAWHFAEGYTGDGFEVYWALQNPGPRPTTVAITYALADGSRVERAVTIAAGRRRTVVVHDAADPGGLGRGQIFAAQLASTSDRLIVVERVHYFRYQGEGVAATGAAVTLGATAPATRWFFAAGDTRPGHDEYLTLHNPTSADGAADLTYYPEDGAAPIGRQVPVPAGRRVTVAVHQAASAANPGGLGRGHRVGLAIASSVPIVAERPMYGQYAGADGLSVAGGHSLVGATRGLGGGERVLLVDGLPGATCHASLHFLNPNDTPAVVTVTARDPDGAPRHESLTLAAGRRTVGLPRPAADPRAAGPETDQISTTLVTVETVGALGLIVERVVYFRLGEVAGAAATFGVPFDTPPATDG